MQTELAQYLPITMVFKIKHNPGTPEHLHELARRYFEGKGIVLRDDNVIEV
jgi:hypothetical protein